MWCNAGVSGEVRDDIIAPYYISSCSDIACPTNSSGLNIASVSQPCTCNPGCSGDVVPSTTSPYYTVGCAPLRCPQNSTGENVMLGCRCRAGFSGIVVATKQYPFYTTSCIPVPCPINSVGIDVIQGCLLPAGFRGSVTSISVTPFFSSSIQAVACPANSLFNCFSIASISPVFKAASSKPGTKILSALVCPAKPLAKWWSITRRRHACRCLKLSNCWPAQNTTCSSIAVLRPNSRISLSKARSTALAQICYCACPRKPRPVPWW